MKKQNEHVGKRKMQFNNFYALMRVFVASYAAFLLCCLIFVSFLGSSAPFSFCLGSPTCLSSCPMPTLVLRSPTILLFFFMLSPAPPYLAYTAFKTFRQALLDEFLCYRLTNFTNLLCPFLPFGLLLDKTNRKRTFDLAFVNSCPLDGNHA